MQFFSFVFISGLCYNYCRVVGVRMMKKKLKLKRPINKMNPVLLLGTVLIVLLLSISVGFSALTTTLSVNGSAAFIPVGMIRVMQYKQNSLFQATETSKTFSPDTINSIVSINQADGTATYDVTIRNLGQIDQVLDNIIEEIFTNSECTYELNGFSIGDVVEAGESVDFTITFKYKGNVTTPVDTNLNAKLKFVFKDYEETDNLAYFRPFNGANDFFGFTKSGITSFSRSTLTKEEVLAKSGVQNIKNESNDQYNSTTDVYGYVENGHFYWWSDADIVYFHPSTLKAFKSMGDLLTVDLTGTSSEKVENFAHWFDTCRKLTTITGSIDTSGLKLEYSNTFNYANDTNNDSSSGYGLTYMFNDCNALTAVDLSKFNTTNASDMKRMFGGCKALTSIDVSGFDTSNVRSMYWMFRNNEKLTNVDLSNFDTSNVENMFGMFVSAKKIETIKFGEHFDTSKVKNMTNMFYSASNLTTIYAKLDFIRKSDLVSSNMFNGTTKLVGGAGTEYQTPYNSGKKDKTYAQIANSQHPGYFTLYGAEVIRYTITYNLNGGVASNPTSYIESDLPITLNPPTKTGYIFTGWTGSNGSTPQTSVTIEEGTAENLEYTANYIKEYFTVVFHSNGGTGTMDDQIFYVDEFQSLSANTFTKQGYQFSGWNTEADGSGTTIINEKQVGNLIPSGEYHLYAQWYDPNAGSQLVFNVPGPCSFNGVSNNASGSNCLVYGNNNSINTNLKLFNAENRLKDFLLSFDLSYDASNQEANQSTVINTFPESSSTNNPGIVFRRSTNTQFEIIARDDKGTANVKISTTDFNSLKIIRKNNKVCYSVNNGNFKFLYDFSNSASVFDTPLSLGSSTDKNGNVWRTINGTLSNMSVYLGTLDNSYQCDESMT